MRSFIWIIVTSFSILFFSVSVMANLMDYVHEEQDFYVMVNGLTDGLNKLSDVSELYSYVVSDSGLAIGKVIQRFKESISYDRGVDASIIEKALSKPFLLTGKGTVLNVDAILSVDPNYFVELLKHLGDGFAVVFDVDSTEEASSLLLNVAKLLKGRLERFPTSYQLKTEESLLYAWMNDDVLIVAGSEPTILNAVEASSDPKYRLLNSSETASKTYENFSTSWVSGYFSKDSLKLNLGVQLTTNTEYVTFSASVTDGGLVIDIYQGITLSGTPSTWNPFTVNEDLKSLEGQKVMGNYLVTLSPEMGTFAMNEFEKWVKARKEATESSIYSLVENLLNNAEAISLSGDFTISTPTFSLILKDKDGFEDAWSRLSTWGVEAEKMDNGWKVGKLKSNDASLYFLELPENLFAITSIEPMDFMKSFRDFPTLGVEPGYSILKDELFSNCAFLSFIDISSALSRIFGKLPVGAIVVQEKVVSDEMVRYRIVAR